MTHVLLFRLFVSKIYLEYGKLANFRTVIFVRNRILIINVYFFICLSNRLSVSCLCFLCVFFQSINLSALFICPSAWLMMQSAFWSGRPFICLNRYRYQLVRLSKRPLDFSSVNLSTSVAFFSTISLLSQLHMTIPLLFCFLFCDKKGFLVFVFSW